MCVRRLKCRCLHRFTKTCSHNIKKKSVKSSHLGKDEVPQPANAVDVVPVNVPCGEIWEVDLLGDERPGKQMGDPNQILMLERCPSPPVSMVMGGETHRLVLLGLYS